MRIWIVFYLIMGVSSSSLCAATPAKPGSYSFSLKSYAGIPLLVVLADSKKDAQFLAQFEAIKTQDKDLRKAGVRTFYAFESGAGRNGSLVLRESDSKELRKLMGATEGGFQIFLIGKDGKRIGESKSPLNAETLLSWLIKKLNYKKS